MKERTMTMPQIGLIAVTRVALGIGIGLLLSGKLDESARRGAGWALLTVGRGDDIAPHCKRCARTFDVSRETGGLMKGGSWND
jgi:hypothetical protein